MSSLWSLDMGLPASAPRRARRADDAWAIGRGPRRPLVYQEDGFRERIQGSPGLQEDPDDLLGIGDGESEAFSARNGTGNGTKACKYPPLTPRTRGRNRLTATLRHARWDKAQQIVLFWPSGLAGPCLVLAYWI